MPDEGSSSKTAREPPMRAQPTDSLRFMPPESTRERACAFSGIPTSFIIAATACAPRTHRQAVVAPVNDPDAREARGDRARSVGANHMRMRIHDRTCTCTWTCTCT
eukprot:4779912-Prymnesium_polylepis.1